MSLLLCEEERSGCGVGVLTSEIMIDRVDEYAVIQHTSAIVSQSNKIVRL